MLRLSMHTFFSFAKRRSTVVLLLFGLFSVLFTFLFIISRYAMVYEEAKGEYSETRTMYINVEDVLTDEERAGLANFFWENEIFGDTEEMMFYDMENNIIGCDASQRDVMTVNYGRYFTKEEQEGKNVVLLSEAYLRHVDADFIEDMLNETIIIGNTVYSVVGRYNLTIVSSLTNSKEVVIPLKTFICNEYQINRIKILFAQKPEREMIESILEYLNQMEINYSVIEPTWFEKNAVIDALEETGWSLLMVFVCFLSLFSLLKYWNHENYRRLYVYYICGCSFKKISRLIGLNTLYLYVISLTMSLLIYNFVKTYFVNMHYISMLNYKQIGCIYAFMYFIIVIYLKMRAKGQFAR